VADRRRSLLATLEVDRRFGRGQRLARKGDPSGAEREFRAALQLSPAHPHIRIHLAMALADQGRYKEALAETSALARERPTDAVVHLFHGRTLYDAGRYAEAEAAFSRAAELSPDNHLAPAYRLLARAAQGHVGEALAGLKQPGLTGSSAFQARLLLLIEERSLLPKRPDGPAPATSLSGAPNRRAAKRHADRAAGLLERGNANDAVEKMLKALAADPNLPDGREYLAVAALYARRFGLVAEALRGRNKTDPLVAMLLGCASIGLGRLDEGLRLLEAADRRSPEARYYRAVALLAKGRRPQAVREMEAAVELDWELARRHVAEALAAVCG
jgi:tetratricopeptide (TPR) repeat protein